MCWVRDLQARQLQRTKKAQMSHDNVSGNPAETAEQPGTRTPVSQVAEPQKMLPPAPCGCNSRPAASKRSWLSWLALAGLALLAFLVVRSFHGGQAPPPQGRTRNSAGAAIDAAKTMTGDINIYIDALEP